MAITGCICVPYYLGHHFYHTKFTQAQPEDSLPHRVLDRRAQKKRLSCGMASRGVQIRAILQLVLVKLRSLDCVNECKGVEMYWALSWDAFFLKMTGVRSCVAVPMDKYVMLVPHLTSLLMSLHTAARNMTAKSPKLCNWISAAAVVCAWLQGLHFSTKVVGEQQINGEAVCHEIETCSIISCCILFNDRRIRDLRWSIDTHRGVSGCGLVT